LLKFNDKISNEKINKVLELRHFSILYAKKLKFDPFHSEITSKSTAPFSKKLAKNSLD
jgi:hypothetical protein